MEGSCFEIHGSGFRIQDSGFRVQGSGFRVWVVVLRVRGLPRYGGVIGAAPDAPQGPPSRAAPSL